MDALHKLEDMVGGWLEPIPHLPNAWRKWLAENAWWLTLIGVILSIIGIFGLISALSLFSATSGLYSTVIYAPVAQAHGALWQVSIFTSIALIVVSVIIEAMAISPLKAMSKKGWDYIFLALVVSVISGLVGAILNVDIMNLISTAIGAVIGAYVLFEFRSYYKKA